VLEVDHEGEVVRAHGGAETAVGDPEVLAVEEMVDRYP
jgi:hypothetical protein